MCLQSNPVRCLIFTYYRRKCIYCPLSRAYLCKFISGISRLKVLRLDAASTRQGYRIVFYCDWIFEKIFCYPKFVYGLSFSNPPWIHASIVLGKFLSWSNRGMIRSDLELELRNSAVLSSLSFPYI